MAASNVPTNLFGRVSRALPQNVPDTNGTDMRYGRYGEPYVIPMFADLNPLVDEGSYFVTNNGQAAGLANSAATGFVATTPEIVIFNGWGVSDPAAKRIYLDFVRLIQAGTFTAGTSVQIAIVLDSISRYSSGGTELTANIAPSNITVGAVSKARVFVGAITALAAGSAAKQVVGQRYLKLAIAAVNDIYELRLDRADTYSLAPGAYTVQSLPAVSIGPQESALIYMWQPSATAVG